MSSRQISEGKAARRSSLDITDAEVRALSAGITELVAEYFRRVSDYPVFPDKEHTDALGRIRDAPLPEEGEELEGIIEDCRTLTQASRHNGHPRFFGYVASPSTPVGAYADLFTSALNQNVTAWRSAPAATEVERTVVGWLGQLAGFGPLAQGLLTSGGSMANLTALVIAHRSRASHDIAREGLWKGDAPMTIYASDQVHLSIPKAADIMGLGRNQVRIVDSDAAFRLDARALRAAIERDATDGLKPFCVVASAGTVATGAVDPLADIAKVAREHNLWFHVDGAYGAFGAMDARKRELFCGLEKADSLSLDAHKWLYAPLDCGCLLFRDAARARAAFSPHEADYIKVHEEEEREAFAFWDYGVELSRRARALKIWMMLRYYGARRLAEAVAEDNALAAFWAERVRASADFELLAPVELSICCFRYVPPEWRAQFEREASAGERERLESELDSLNARIMHAVQRGGRAYISNATLGGRFALRACLTNFRTTRADILQTLDIIRDAAQEEVTGPQSQL